MANLTAVAMVQAMSVEGCVSERWWGEAVDTSFMMVVEEDVRGKFQIFFKE